MSRPFTSSSRRSLAVGALLVGLAAIVLLVPILELWDADLHVPIASVYEPENDYVYAGDAPFYLMLAKGGIDHAWFLTNPTLGWPLGQQVYDLPQSLDNLNLVGIKALGLVFGDAAATINVFFVLTFATVAVSAFLVLRRLRVTAPAAFVAALLFTFLPYHFARGSPHVLLSSYWVVPIAVYLILRVVSARPPFTTATDTPRGYRLRLFDRSGVLWLLACCAIASTGSYYGVFTVFLLIALALVDVLANRRARVAASAAVALAVIALAAFVNLLPTFVYWATEGTNPAMFSRLPYETEYEGLKVSQLVLPIRNHRIPAFADKEADTLRFTPVPSESGQNLGIIGTVGFVGLLGALLLAARRTRAPRPPEEPDRGEEPTTEASGPSPPATPTEPSSPIEPAMGSVDLVGDGLSSGVVLRTLGILVVVSILIATVSGFSLLISGAGFRDIRSYNRIVVFIAFAALVAVAFGLDWVGRRLPDTAWRAPVAAIGLALVLVVGVLDQVSPASIPDYAATKARWDSDDAFVGRIERILHDGSEALADRSTSTPAVFQLPYRYFPEAPDIGLYNRLGPYDLVRGYLHSDDLNWSWGAVRGRGADWQLRAVRQPVGDFLDRIAAVGYSGIMLDTSTGYDDGAPREAQLSEALGPPIISANRELRFWDLRTYAADLRDRIGAKGVERLRAKTLADVPEVHAQGH
jgi:phosphoglycerol transferase